ncbi:MAG: exodeoxyribonuclease VII small subunit [Rubripirellula sp.]
MAKKSVRKSQAEAVNFEGAVAEVEQIVGRLESGELGLTESLEQYERAVNQLKNCHGLLNEAEQRVSVLSGFDADGNPVTEPMGGAKKKPSASKKGRGAALTEEQQNDNVDDPPGLF